MLRKDGLLSHWERAFTATELADASTLGEEHYLEYLASNFAVKEATYKAVGGLPTHEIDWQEIEVTRLKSGQPSVRLSGEFGRYCSEEGVSSWSISISRSGTHAVASAIAISL